MFQNRTLRELSLVAGLWLTTSAAMAAPQSDHDMQLGASALPPPAFMAFCERQPLDCGDDAGLVLASARRAEADRAALLASVAAPLATASIGPAASSPAVSPPAAELSPSLVAAPLATPMVATIQLAPLPTKVVFVDPTERARETDAAGPPAMTPELWAKLNAINDRINRSIVEQTDIRTYGVDDYWSTPIEDGVRYGDCEDYVLEKRRALLAAGVPRKALNIALVTTSWGESHAVLLVSTRAGDFVLDSLSPWVMPWRQVNYLWRQRQVDGDPFNWVMIRDPRLEPARPQRLLVAEAQ